MEKYRKNMFLQEMPAKVFISLLDGNSYITQISKNTECTYAHLFNLVKTFKKMGFVSLERKGRTLVVKLTDSGAELAKKLLETANLAK